MTSDPDIASVGSLLGDGARAQMLLALLGGDALSAGRLAEIGGVSPSGATAHIRRLRDGGLVTCERSGRRLLVRLANDETAAALEALARIAPRPPVRTLRQSAADDALRRARTCYDHLAGELGVAVTDALVERKLLRAGDGAFDVPAAGVSWFGQLGVDVEQVRERRRAFARECVDWTERRPHLAGALGAGLADAFVARRFVERLPGGRALAVTSAGRRWLRRELALDLA
ncbi:MAG TPA: helix-turn-helix transcriptional regulator [Gaiellaceae bacterium]|nr:helix-turn-helix transcriptional regulator [Gaiellaceae bacterium]